MTNCDMVDLASPEASTVIRTCAGKSSLREVPGRNACTPRANSCQTVSTDPGLPERQAATIAGAGAGAGAGARLRARAGAPACACAPPVPVPRPRPCPGPAVPVPRPCPCPGLVVPFSWPCCPGPGHAFAPGPASAPAVPCPAPGLGLPWPRLGPRETTMPALSCRMTPASRPVGQPARVPPSAGRVRQDHCQSCRW
jgi:hypothetical protein